MIKKKVFVVAILILLLSPMVSAQERMGNDNGLRKTPWFMFDFELEISYNTSAVNNATFTPDGPPVSIPLYIKYRADIPNFFLRPPFLFLKAWFVFGRLSIPTQKIHLSVINPPDWAAISITPSNPYINIDNTFQEATAILQIAVHFDAPSEGYVLKIKAEAPRLGRLQQKDADLDLIFMPAWMPLLSIDLSQPYIRTPPNETTTTTIDITNLGNAECLVTANITEIIGWSIYLDQAQFWLSIGQTKSITLFLKPPENFQGIQEINISFTPSRHPGETGPPVPVTIHAYFP
jgi:hypothetical protein